MQSIRSKRNSNVTFITKVKLSALAATAAAVAGGVAVTTTTAHADAQPNPQPGSSQEDQPASALKAQQDASRHVYADAKTANDDAQGKLAQAESNKNAAQTAVNTASDNVQSAAASERNAQTQVDHAQADVNTAQGQYDQAVQQAAQGAADAHAIADAQQAVTNANQAVTDAQSDLAQKQGAQAQAQNNADTAAQNVKDAKTGVTNAQTAVNTAQGDLTNAQNHAATVQADQNAVDAAQTAKNTADSKVSDAQTDSDNKNAAVTDAQTNVDNAQKAVDKLSNGESSEPVQETINVNNDYINLVKQIQQRLSSPSNTTDMDFTDAEGQAWHRIVDQLRQTNHYIDDPTQTAIPVHINSNGLMSKNDQIDAARFYLSLINPIRKACGLPELKLSEQSLAMGDQIATAYNNDNWCIYPFKVNHDLNVLTYDSTSPHFSQHDLNAIYQNGATGESAVAIHNSTVTEYNTPNDPTSGIKTFHYNTNWATNRNELHKAIFQNVIDNILESSYAAHHAAYVLGLHTSDVDTGNGFFSVQTDKYGQVHVNMESKADNSKVIPLTDTSTADDHATQLANAKQALQEAQSKLASAKTAADQANADLASAKTAAASAAQALADAKAKLSRDQNGTMSVADAQAALTAAQATLAQKQTNLTAAQDAQTRAETMQTAANTALDSANAAVTAAQTAVANAKAAAQTAQGRLDALTSANAAVNDAKAKLDTAKEQLQVAQSNHDTARDALTQAQRDLNAKEAALRDAQTALQAAQTQADATAAALSHAKANLISDARLYGDSIEIKQQTVHAGDSLAAPVIENGTKVDPTQDLALGAFLRLASAPLDDIPTGTTAAWADAAQVQRDAQTPGQYQEDVLITFPDGSTSIAHMFLQVLAATPSLPDQPSHPDHGQHAGTHGANQAHGTGAAAGHNAGMAGRNDGGITNGNSRLEGSDVEENGAVLQGMAHASATNRSALSNGRLPQTGRGRESGLVALGIVAMLSMLGLSVSRRKN